MTVDREAGPARGSRVAAVAAVAATYFYFLIFAEFALLALARPFAPDRAGILPMLGVLAAGGIAGSFAGAAWFRPARAHRLLAWLFRLAALGAGLAAFAPNRVIFLIACAVSGLSLGGLTVVLSASLRAATGVTRLGLCAGLGTGLAYGAGSLPAIFAAPAFWQSIAAGLVALAASFTVGRLNPVREPPPLDSDHRGTAGAAWIVMLAALICLDSAAFYSIQHTPGAWSGQAELWGNVAVHLLAAIVAGWAFDRGWRARLIIAAMFLLAIACVLLAGSATSVLARMLYITGVSLYSVVLVAYPALAARPWLAARTFALAGWVGSALGIGLVLPQTQIPTTGIAVAAAVLVAALVVRQRAL